MAAPPLQHGKCYTKRHRKFHNNPFLQIAKINLIIRNHGRQESWLVTAKETLKYFSLKRCQNHLAEIVTG